MYGQIAGHQMQIGAFIVTAYKSHFLKMTVNGQKGQRCPVGISAAHNNTDIYSQKSTSWNSLALMLLGRCFDF